MNSDDNKTPVKFTMEITPVNYIAKMKRCDQKSLTQMLGIAQSLSDFDFLSNRKRAITPIKLTKNKKIRRVKTSVPSSINYLSKKELNRIKI